MLVMSRTVMTFIIFLPTFFIYLSVPLSSLILHHCFHWTCFAQIRLQLKQVYFAAFICIHEWLHLLLVFLLALPLSFIIFTIPLMSWCFSLWQRQSLKKKKREKASSSVLHFICFPLIGYKIELETKMLFFSHSERRFFTFIKCRLQPQEVKLMLNELF